MNIGIVGLGLIGGSLGLSLRGGGSAEHPSHAGMKTADEPRDRSSGHRVLGVSRRDDICQLAIACGAADEASTDLNLLSSADIVFVCTPLTAIESIVKQLVESLSPDAVITDVGSVKQSIVATATALWPNFVGGHPMAGTADSGLAAALPGLFVDRPYVITPIATTSAAAVQRVKDVVALLGSRIYTCTPDAHDRAVAWISHLPAMVSASLIQACLSDPDQQTLELAQQLASSGFCDTSRVGGGNPELRLMMAMHNRQALLQSLYAYRNQYDRLVVAIEQEDWSTLTDIFTQTHQARPAFVR